MMRNEWVIGVKGRQADGCARGLPTIGCKRCSERDDKGFLQFLNDDDRGLSWRLQTLSRVSRHRSEEFLDPEVTMPRFSTFLYQRPQREPSEGASREMTGASGGMAGVSRGMMGASGEMTGLSFPKWGGRSTPSCYCL